MATLDDILTTLKNGVIAINNLSQATQKYNPGQYTSSVITSVSGSTLVTTGAGRLIYVTVLVRGTGDGFCYNAANIATATSSVAIGVCPYAASGTYLVNSIFTSGLVVSPGAGQSVCVTYSLN